jgi:hypothetical protein
MNDEMSQNVPDVHKQIEFSSFLRLIEQESVPDSWELIAEAIGVHRNTITKWKKTPEFQKALAVGIKNAIANMENSGRRDWRMWREKIALLTKEKEEAKNITNILVIPSELMAKYGITQVTENSSV